VFDIFARSEHNRNGEVTHQHPQYNSPGLFDKAQAADAVLTSWASILSSRLARRDATKCMSDGTCADGRLDTTQDNFVISTDRNYATSCCSLKGICGYGPDFCGVGNVRNFLPRTSIICEIYMIFGSWIDGISHHHGRSTDNADSIT
jgi:hypothetical protein